MMAALSSRHFLRILLGRLTFRPDQLKTKMIQDVEGRGVLLRRAKMNA